MLRLRFKLRFEFGHPDTANPSDDRGSSDSGVRRLGLRVGRRSLIRVVQRAMAATTLRGASTRSRQLRVERAAGSDWASRLCNAQLPAPESAGRAAGRRDSTVGRSGHPWHA